MKHWSDLKFCPPTVDLKMVLMSAAGEGTSEQRY